MRNKNRRPELETYRERRLKRWARLNEQHRRECFRNKKRK